ncbi:STAS domain-containing protein [Texcoconibacillus texcoconensis]|uniref:Anti-sigma factor antagonist n=1 Tax=Texcoconibacillus texcoconensis TaxID=1095777 RepID=A0A840QSB3_9BACI|nr:STAS domain-containing protein [Texcoconibacillus texcoconensis]MBB5174208.1 anti-sigma B factor antagonist [Texcoconibacillus texcoconensis]
MNLELQVQERENESTVFLQGEVDVYTASTLKESLLPLTEKQDEKVVVDLSEVDYIDSTGLGIFIGALKSTDKHGSSLKLVGLNDRVSRLFDITGLNEVMDIEEGKREEA